MDPVSIAAIGWGFSAAGWLISPVLSRLLNKCFDALDIDPKFRSRKNVLLGKLENLQTTLLPKLLILTEATKQSDHRQFLKEWLQKLKSAFYEAEHVLGLVEYQRLEKEVNSLFPSTSKFNLKRLKGKLSQFSSEKKKLIKSLENLEKIVNEAMKLVPLLNLPSSSFNNSTQISNEQYRITISTPGSKVIGRDNDRDHIVKLLRENTSESTSDAKSYSVIGIWGIGGSGKTTLVQYVCEHEKKEKMGELGKYFDPIIWVYVSEKFSVHAIMRKIWEFVSKGSCPNYENLDVLISEVAAKLREKRYLLVLDDVWCDKGVSEQELNQLFAPLRGGMQGSKILVTTRHKEAARVLGTMDLIKLPELADDDFLSLFMNHALCDVKVTENLEIKLRAIGKMIVSKLCRLPLAATTVAGQLRRRLDPEFWSSMLNRSLLNDAMGALFLSYQHLPPALQRCFAFCSLFPKGHRFRHDHLVNLWIAEGFIEIEDSNKQMKDVASDYILELVSSSFFQIDEWDINTYYMHDLMHVLAQYASEGDYFRIECGEDKEIPSHTRHIYVVDHMLGEYVEKISKLKYLRTIIVSRSRFQNFLWKVDLDALFTKLRKLWVVEIEVHVARVPKSVVHLRNLRYLNFERVQTIAHLSPYQLWFRLPKYYGMYIRNKSYGMLIRNKSYKNSEERRTLAETRNSLNRLYQLRFLCAGTQIPNVGRLISLQDLKKFRVRIKRGFELKQLEHLNDITGSLSIYGLEDVKSKEEADLAKISDKMGLQKLLFSWNYKSRYVLRDIDVGILDGLCPPPQIKELTIEGYSGKRFPTWILKNNENIIHLQHLYLADCGGLEVLDRINELSDLLSLTISFLPRLKSWVPLPLKLTQLIISHCLSLDFVLKEDLEMIMSTKGTRISQIVTFIENSRFNDGYFHFKRVQELMKLGNHIEEQALSTISKDLKKCLEKELDLICQPKDVCDKLSLPIALQKLSIETCFITDTILAGSLYGLTSLTQLTLKDIITIMCIPKEVLSSLTNLLNLSIKGCLLLTSIGGLDTHNNLEELQIIWCPNLSFEISFDVASSSDTVDNLPQLKELRISRWSLLEQLVSRDGFSCLGFLELVYAQQEYFSQEEHEMFHYLSSLREIRFYHCKMRSLPNLLCLYSLIELEIGCCENLKSLPELPPSIQCIKIYGCDEEFTRSCTDQNNPNWHKISHIPNKNVKL